MKTNLLLILVVLYFSTYAMGCNMVKGAGKDVENAGKSVQKTVDHNE